MIKQGDRVRIKAICKRDAFCTDKKRFQGKTATVISDKLFFCPKCSTFAGKVKFDDLDHTIYFASVQVKKLKGGIV